MRTLFFMFILLVVSGCVEDSDCRRGELPPPESILFKITDEGAFTGAMEIYPCVENSNIYFGNYVNGVLGAINSSYIVAAGRITSTGVPLSLPDGPYRALYWGVDSSRDYFAGQVSGGPLSVGVDMATLYWRLRRNSDGTYKPTYSQVFAAGPMEIGATKQLVGLRRVVAGITIEITFKDGSPFGDNIESFAAHISGIAHSISYTSSEPDFSTGTVTVKIPIEIAADRLKASNVMALLYPSTDDPQVRIDAKLTDGTTKSYTTTLSRKFTAGQAQNVYVVINEITSGLGSPEVFSVDRWTEFYDIINANHFD